MHESKTLVYAIDKDIRGFLKYINQIANAESVTIQASDPSEARTEILKQSPDLVLARLSHMEMPEDEDLEAFAHTATQSAARLVILGHQVLDTKISHIFQPYGATMIEELGFQTHQLITALRETI